MKFLVFVGLFVACATSSESHAQQRSGQTTYAPDCGMEHRLMDYMIGEWRVVQTATGQPFAHNFVEQSHGGCSVRESLRMSNGSVGTAVTFYSPTEKVWHTFFHDSLGFYAHLTGLTDTGGRQELTADVRFVLENGRVRKVRQVTFKDGEGRPRQIGYSMSARDPSGQQLYDITFCPADRNDPRNKTPC